MDGQGAVTSRDNPRDIREDCVLRERVHVLRWIGSVSNGIGLDWIYERGLSYRAIYVASISLTRVLATDYVRLRKTDIFFLSLHFCLLSDNDILLFDNVE